MAKRKPAKPVPMTRAGRVLRAARRPIVDKAAAFAMPGPAERDARQAALHSALAKFVERKGIGAVEAPSATGSEIAGDLTPGSPEAQQGPASPPDETLAVQGDDCRPESTSAQETPIQREVEPEIGDFRIDQLGMDQCRFACTADDVPRGQHRFCGAPTEIGPGNRWGSWCSKHLPRVFSDTSTMARPAFLKNAERSAR